MKIKIFIKHYTGEGVGEGGNILFLSMTCIKKNNFQTEQFIFKPL